MAVIIAQNLVTVAGSGDVPALNHPRIGYQTVTDGNTPTVSGTASGFFAGTLSNQLTREFWKPDASPATVEYDFSDQTIDYVAIGAHSLGTTQTTVKIEYSTDSGSTYTEITEFIPADDNAIMSLFDEVDNVNNVKLTFTYSGNAPVISVIYIGQVLSMQRAIYGGHSPITLSRNVINRPQVSESGQWIGASNQRRAFRSSAAFRNLTAQWYRDNFDDFVYHASKTLPFFFAWNPDEWPAEVAFCWCNDNIAPSNMGIRDLMEVSFSLEGYGVDA